MVSVNDINNDYGTTYSSGLGPSTIENTDNDQENQWQDLADSMGSIRKSSFGTSETTNTGMGSCCRSANNDNYSNPNSNLLSIISSLVNVISSLIPFLAQENNATNEASSQSTEHSHSAHSYSAYSYQAHHSSSSHSSSSYAYSNQSSSHSQFHSSSGTGSERRGGGILNRIADVIGSIGSFFGRAIGNLGIKAPLQIAGGIIGGVIKGAKDGFNIIKKATRPIWHPVQNVLHKIGHGIKKTAEKVGNFFKKLF